MKDDYKTRDWIKLGVLLLFLVILIVITFWQRRKIKRKEIERNEKLVDVRRRRGQSLSDPKIIND